MWWVWLRVYVWHEVLKEKCAVLKSVEEKYMEIPMVELIYV